MNEKIIAQLADIQAEVEAIAKDRKNTQQNYKFRGVEDVLNTIHGLLAKHRVIVSTRKVGEGILEERRAKSGGVLITRVYDYEFDFVAEDGSKHTVGPIPGEGMDSGDKASNKTIANAYKYCIFFTFSIPTQDLVTESDAESPGINGNGEPPKSAKTKPATATKQAAAKEAAAGEAVDGDLRQELTGLLDRVIDSADDKLKKEAERAKESMQNIKDKKSLQNFLNLWTKKVADLPVTTEQVVDAVQGELAEDDPELSAVFDNS